jgi:hypothetical protein
MDHAVTTLIVGVVIVILTAILAYTVRINDRQREQGEDIATLKTQISPLWQMVQAKITKDLHHPHPRYLEMDTLLEKLDALTITDNERLRLKVLLKERAQDMHADITPEQRISAEILLPVMDRVVMEIEKGDGET